MELAKKIKLEHDTLKGDRSTWDTRWQKLLEWITPYNAMITERDKYAPTMQHRSKVHDTKAAEALDVLTSAHMSYITPLNERWLMFEAPYQFRGNDEVESYFKRCSEIAMDEIARSNFYTESHSVYADRSHLGTCAQFVDDDGEGGLHFKYIPTGSFTFSESAKSVADTFYREFELTLEQMVEEFGEENLGDKLTAQWKTRNQKPEVRSMKCSVIHCVKPRKKRDVSKPDMFNMPFADYYVCNTDQCMLKEGGYEEFPYMVSRYKRWGNYQWGYSPAFSAMPNILSANYLKQIMKTIGEVQAVPRILQLAEQKRQVDLRAGGITTVSREAAAMGFPKEWGSQGRFDIGAALLEMEHNAIDRFFHVPLFRMFADIDKQMTATEVGAREREKLLLFAPSFTQHVTDMTPLLIRVFSILMRAGKFPDPPAALIEDRGDGFGVMPDPVVVVQSRVALAIKSLQAEGYDRVIMRLMNVAEVNPDVFDNFDWDKLARDMARNEAMPEQWLRAFEEVQAIRAERAKIAAQQAQVAQAQEMAKAVKDVGGVDQVEQLASEV